MEKVKRLYPLKFEEGSMVLDQNTVVANGFLAENSIDDIIETYLEDFLGRDVFQYYKGEFPLRVSYLESDGNMPLQAHPNDFTALERYESIGCAKVWYILEAEKDARICLGFSRQMDASSFYEECLGGELEKDLNFISPQAGDCIYIEPGTVYAALGKIKYIEVAQNSRVTYHLYDFNCGASTSSSGSKVQQDGNDYMMEISEAIDVINYEPFDRQKYLFKNISGNLTIADTSDFIIKLLSFGNSGAPDNAAVSAIEISPESLESFVALLCLKGKVKIKAEDGVMYEITQGEFSLLPANLRNVQLLADDAVVIESYMPLLSGEDLYMNYYEDESNYPEGSGLDPEDDEDSCDCGDDECDCHHHHHSHHHDHHHGGSCR